MRAPDPAAVAEWQKRIMKWAKKNRMTVLEAMAIRELARDRYPEDMSDMALAMYTRALAICEEQVAKHGHDIPVVGFRSPRR